MNVPPPHGNTVPIPHAATDDIELLIRQTPDRAKVAAGKEKDRKPVDPPPIIQVKFHDHADPHSLRLQSPYFFLLVQLWHATEEKPAFNKASDGVGGTLVSSLHRLKDIDNSEGGFFVFGDFSVKKEGEFRLHFNLYELRVSEFVSLKQAISKTFRVYPTKSFPGMTDSTTLSRSFGDQGVRLRVRKESRARSHATRPDTTPTQPFQPQDLPANPHQVGEGRAYPEFGTPDASSYPNGTKRPRLEETTPPSNWERDQQPRYNPSFYPGPGSVPYAMPAPRAPNYATQQAYATPYSTQTGVGDYPRSGRSPPPPMGGYTLQGDVTGRYNIPGDYQDPGVRHVQMHTSQSYSYPPPGQSGTIGSTPPGVPRSDTTGTQYGAPRTPQNQMPMPNNTASGLALPPLDPHGPNSQQMPGYAIGNGSMSTQDPLGSSPAAPNSGRYSDRFSSGNAPKYHPNQMSSQYITPTSQYSHSPPR